MMPMKTKRPPIRKFPPGWKCYIQWQHAVWALNQNDENLLTILHLSYLFIFMHIFNTFVHKFHNSFTN